MANNIVNIVNWLGNDFESGCLALGKKIEAQYKPDLVIGIRTGGAVIADAVCRLVPSLSLSRRCDIESFRPSTAKKRILRLRHFLRLMPLKVCDALRVAELVILRRKLQTGRYELIRPVTISQETVFRIREAKSIVVIDDAIDSGATLMSVLNQIRLLNTDAQLHSAVVTVTLECSAILPDITMYRGVVVRFPWSSDAPRSS